MKTNYLWVDQYGSHIFARTKKELREKAGYSASTKGFHVMRDTDEGPMIVGHGVGARWFTQYAPVEVKA